VTLDAAGVPATGALSYFSRLADATTFGERATGELHRRGTTTAQTVAAITDGAGWCQGVIDLHRPDAVRMLDVPHALEHLGAAAQAVWGRGQPETSAWLGTQAQALRHGREDEVLTALSALDAQPGLSAASRDTLRRPGAYFTTRRAHIRYQAFTDAGYPIGSGCVESANKLVVEARLKGAGRHWARAHVNPLLALRTMIANDLWAESWPLLWGKLRSRPAPPAPTPPPVAADPIPGPVVPDRPSVSWLKLVVDGQPTPDHPWRRPSPFLAKR